jgi:uncharacterized protein YegL
MASFENNIQDSVIEIHNDSSSLPFLHLNSGEYFGVLKLKMKKVEITKKPVFLCFTIDKSGSMNEYSSSTSLQSTRKMDYVIQTFINMINYFARLENEMYIQVNTFSDNVVVMVDCVRINKENVDEIANIIRSIQSDGSTNIESALKSANYALTDYSSKYPDHQIGHIFMTDGDPTFGEMSHDKLVEFVDEKFPNIFVGFGSDHNTNLLRKFSDKKLAEYQFVDNMEHTALIYGEVIHQFIYPAIYRPAFSISNGEIYNWRENKWVTTMSEPVIVSEIEKIYHIKTRDPRNVVAEIFGSTDSEKHHLLDTVVSMPDLINIETYEIIKNDLTKYAYRQKVQELLYTARDERNLRGEKKHNFKKLLRDIFRNIRIFMRENNIIEDGLLKMLCDDIVLVYKSLNENALLDTGRIALARHTSQGRQQTYNSTPRSSGRSEGARVPPTTPRRGMMHGIYSRPMVNTTEQLDYEHSGYNTPEISLHTPPDEINEETFEKYIQSGLVDGTDTVFRSLSEESDEELDSEDNIENYIPSNNTTTCFATPGTIRTMRDVSQSVTDDV